jgi:hypothetical protein
MGIRDWFRGSTEEQQQTTADTVESDQVSGERYTSSGAIPPVAQGTDSDSMSKSASDQAYARMMRTRPASNRTMSTMPLSVALKTLLGSTYGSIDDAAKAAVKMANKEGFVIQFEFNEQEVLVEPGDKPKDVVARYMHDSSLPSPGGTTS